MRIPGFEPSFRIGVDSIRQAHGARLARLAGRRLTGFALVRFAEDGEWFADCPVVLDFDGIQVEVCHWKLDELSIGWDTIDTAAPILGWECFELTPQRMADLDPGEAKTAAVGALTVKSSAAGVAAEDSDRG
ncbi:hypothetical protein [Streptomyces venezuelae]